MNMQGCEDKESYIDNILSAIGQLGPSDARKYVKLILTTNTLANWMDKVGTTSKSDVKQKEKKP